jgi:hypothetical protein
VLASEIGRLTANIEKGIVRNSKRVSSIEPGGGDIDVQAAMDTLAHRHEMLVLEGTPKATHVMANDL